MRHLLAAVLAIALLGVPWFAVNYPSQAGAIISATKSAFEITRDYASLTASAILSKNPKTIASIQARYRAASIPAAPKVRVLLVPGHEPGYGGAEYRSEHGDIRERDLNVRLADELSVFLANDDRYETFVTRDDSDWHPAFVRYFEERWDDIVSWHAASKREASRLKAVGGLTPSGPKVGHNKAPDTVAFRLYGITKWANENNLDIVIHIHFNDETEHAVDEPGEHSGFAIYVPDTQYDNGTTTRAIAETLFGRLARYNAVSSLKGESTGIVNEADLIAIGANNTSDAASLLIEYAYIYEPVIVDPRVRGDFVRELAYETYLGLQDFFTPSDATVFSRGTDTLVLPRVWKDPIDGKDDTAQDIFALQTALILDGSYPPSGKSLNDCPRTGNFAGCTKAALDAFQSKYGITGETGIAGPKTIEQLMRIDSVRPL